jgi:DNA-binding MarR family transcriptional regulator
MNMVSISSSIEEIVQFEPLLQDLLDNSLTDQHIRIIALMFKLGGYTTLNVLTKVAAMTQPTVSNRVSELVELGYIRKNPELKPKVLVLLLSIDELSKLLSSKIDQQRDATSFLNQMAKIRDKTLATETILQAIDLIFPENELLSATIANIYLSGIISRNNLFNAVNNGSSNNTKIERQFDNLLMTRSDLFHIIFQKHQKKETFVRPRLPLDLFVQNRLDYLEAKNIYSNRLLLDLKQFISSEFDSVIPHQPLKYPTDIKHRINTNLKHYTDIRVITNDILKKRTNTGKGTIDLIHDNENFSNHHNLRILTGRKEYSPEIKTKNHVKSRHIGEKISSDYRERDFIIFDNHSCLIIPSNPKITPYYNISPGFIRTCTEFFEANWRYVDDL